MKRRLISWLLVLTFVIAAIPATALPVFAEATNKVQDATVPFSRIERGQGTSATDTRIKFEVKGWSDHGSSDSKEKDHFYYYLTNTRVITADQEIPFTTRSSVVYNSNEIQSIKFPASGLNASSTLYMYWIVLSGDNLP
ncbi:MAG: hypothetical protein IKL81_04345, partial [Clostridia bacterium]|nr:hypothetical protein [Clostridia bacterium]